MLEFEHKLALHTWTLDTTPLADALGATRRSGWDAIELRHVDFMRCHEQGLDNDAVLDLVRASGLTVATLGTEYGLIFAEGPERARLLDALEQTCANAVALDCDMIMIAPGPNDGSLETAAANFRLGGEVARRFGVRLALEFSVGHRTLNRLSVARDILAIANHACCGLLLDMYHLERTGDGGRGFGAVPPQQIFAVQYSDVPASAASAERRPIDRLAPGLGTVRWSDVFSLLSEKGYAGYLSYEAPNPAHWERPPLDVAREGVEATRSLLRRL